MSGGSNHGGRPPSCRSLLPSCHLASLDAEGYLSVGASGSETRAGHSPLCDISRVAWFSTADQGAKGPPEGHDGELLAGVPGNRPRRVSDFVRMFERGRAGDVGERPRVFRQVDDLAGSGGHPGSTWSVNRQRQRHRRPGAVAGHGWSCAHPLKASATKPER